MTDKIHIIYLGFACALLGALITSGLFMVFSETSQEPITYVNNTVITINNTYNYSQTDTNEKTILINIETFDSEIDYFLKIADDLAWEGGEYNETHNDCRHFAKRLYDVYQFLGYNTTLNNGCDKYKNCHMWVEIITSDGITVQIEPQTAELINNREIYGYKRNWNYDEITDVQNGWFKDSYKEKKVNKIEV